MMKAYTITNEYVELIVNGNLTRCIIEGTGRNRYITLDGAAYQVGKLV